MVTTLWNIFLIVGLAFLIFLTVYLFIGIIYGVLIGNKKKEKERAKAKAELLKNLEELATEIEKCTCETKKKKTRKSTKKESE